MFTIRRIALAMLLSLGLFPGIATATNTHVITDAQEITSYLSGYDIKSVTYTLDAFDVLTIDIEPYGVPGDADGDGNPGASSNPLIIDQPGVGSTELLIMGIDCTAPDAVNCVPDVTMIYTNNALTINPATAGSATLVLTASAYVITIPNFSVFKANLGGTPLDFGAFNFTASITDNQTDDFAPDTGCELISLTPPVAGKTPFECFTINKVEVEDEVGTDGDDVKIEKAGFRLGAGDVVDLSTDMVQIRVDGLVFDFPPGSFVQSGANLDFRFKSASGAKPKISARIHFNKRQWELKVEDGDVTLIDNSDGVDIALMIGNFESMENIVLTPKGNGDLKFTRNPKSTCNTNDDGTKLSCIASLTVQHTSGTLITKSTAEGNLIHAETAFVDETSGDLTTYHTSCSQCLTCGQVSGNFTIVEISSLPGDKLAVECGVPDASCSTLP